MNWVSDWTAAAVCRTADPDELFVSGAAQNRAKVLCGTCPVRTECLADALDNRVEFGVWGGMTERERRALLRRRPTVTSWRRLLETAKSEYETAYSTPGAAAGAGGAPGGGGSAPGTQRGRSSAVPFTAHSSRRPAPDGGRAAPAVGTRLAAEPDRPGHGEHPSVHTPSTSDTARESRGVPGAARVPERLRGQERSSGEVSTRVA